MKIRFELDCMCDEPFNKEEIFELGKAHKIPYILFAFDSNDSHQLPAGWHLREEVFLRGTLEQARSLESILSKSLSCEVFELKSTEYVRI
jgi:hypothetical protein